MASGPRTHCLDRSMYTPNHIKMQDEEGDLSFFIFFRKGSPGYQVAKLLYRMNKTIEYRRAGNPIPSGM